MVHEPFSNWDDPPRSGKVEGFGWTSLSKVSQQLVQLLLACWDQDQPNKIHLMVIS